MARTPAVAADLEGIKDVIAQGENGYRVPTRNADQFAETVKSILSNNLEQFSKQTRSYVQKQFSWKYVAQQYIDFFQTIINRYTPTS
jgi:phosphatidylinositol alpha-1,6-mannosyltransferase